MPNKTKGQVTKPKHKSVRGDQLSAKQKEARKSVFAFRRRVVATLLESISLTRVFYQYDPPEGQRAFLDKEIENASQTLKVMVGLVNTPEIRQCLEEIEAEQPFALYALERVVGAPL